MRHFPLLILFLAFSACACAQLPTYEDTIIKKELKNITEFYQNALENYPQDQSIAKILKQTEEIEDKLNFLQSAIAISYYGGEKGGISLHNDLIKPALANNAFIEDEIKRYSGIKKLVDSGFLLRLEKRLGDFYQSQLKNKNHGEQVEGDDDENRLVDVTVKVFSSYGSKTELAGYEVYSDNPYLVDSKEEFNPTTYATKKIEAGYRRFNIKKGKMPWKSITTRIVYGDANTYLVTFVDQRK